MKLSNRQILAIAQLVEGRNEQFSEFMQALGDYGEQLVQQLLYTKDAGDAELKRGMALAVTEVLKAIGSSVEKAKQLKGNT